MTDLALAVDIGGTKMAAGLVTPDGSLVERAMRPTRASSGAVDLGEAVDTSVGEGEAPHSRVEAAETLWHDLAELVQDVMATIVARTASSCAGWDAVVP